MEEIHEEIKEAVRQLETYKNRYRTMNTQDVIDMLKRLNENVKLTLTDVSQQRKLLIADFIEKYNKGLVGNERIHEDCLKDYLQGNL